MRLLGPLGSGEDPKPLSPKPQNQKCTETLNPTAYKPMDSPSVSAETLGQERLRKRTWLWLSETWSRIEALVLQEHLRAQGL